MAQLISVEEAVSLVKSKDLIITSHSSAFPYYFMKKLLTRASELKDVSIMHNQVEGSLDYLAPIYNGVFNHSALMVGSNSKKELTEGRADLLPNRFGKVPQLLYNGLIKPDIAVFQVSPPDKYGYCSYGICTSYLPAAVSTAKITIGEINEKMPATFGARVHISELDYVIETSYELTDSAMQRKEEDPVALKIGENIVNLIDDGSTLQLGLGAIPDAVLKSLYGHKDLGIHSELFSDGVIDLIEKGIVNGCKKTLHPHKLVATFLKGTKRLYNFVNNNPVAEFYPVDYTNNPVVIAQNEKVVAINSAIEVDITGQICAESIGSMQISGTGGQFDFALGASESPGGKFIIALPSTAQNGKSSRIVANLKTGAIVTTPRHLVDYVVTEYGIADLRGKSLRQRAKAMLNIVYPDFHYEIEKQVRERKDIVLD